MADGSRISAPHNLAAEMAVLGAILYDNSALDRVGGLTAGDFHVPANGAIFERARSLIGASKVADGVTLLDMLKGEDYRDVGGPRYLTSLLDAAAFGPEIGDYARLLSSLSARRRLIEAGQSLMTFAWSEQDRAPADIFAEAETILSSASAAHDGAASSFCDARQETMAFLDEMESGAGAGGLITGLDAVDEAGLMPGNLVIMAGRPSMGKTALASSVTTRVAMQAVPEDEPGGWVDSGGMRRRVVVFFSLEMMKQDLAARAASETLYRTERLGVPYKRIRKGACSPEEFARVRAAVREMPRIVWVARQRISIDFVASELRRIKRRYGRIDLVVCDYLQIMDMDVGRSTTAEAIGKVTRGFKSMAIDYQIPVVLLAQVSREVEKRDDKRPRMADLKGSGDIEQDADVVLMIYRAYEYLKKEDPPKSVVEAEDWERELETLADQVEINAEKARMGEQGRRTAYWHAPSGFFCNKREELT